MKLTLFVGLYLLCTVALGLFAATRVKDTTDFALAGRSLPLIMVVTATFATWFGSETVLGLPGQFIQNGLEGVVEEPFGSSMALILVGVFFARKLYKMSLLTVGDFYHRRYGVSVELICSIFVVLSYLGWVAAQVAALGLVINLLTEGFVSISVAMVIGTLVVLLYTVFGGMWSVAVTDFLQMIIIVVGLVIVAFFASEMAGGPSEVITYASDKDLFRFFPEADLKSWLFWISAAITMMIGSIPQQDVFQRVMSAKSMRDACSGPIIGGTFYLLFASVPMFIVIAATVAVPDMANKFMATDPQEILPTFIKEYMPLWLRVMFFGAVLSAVMSTASATMLAPTTTFVENVLRNFIPLTDKRELRAMRISLVVFALGVLAYALLMEGTPIYELAAMAYQFPVIGAFWPLTMGLYWKRSTTVGCWFSIALGSLVWGVLTFSSLGEEFPALLGGFLASGIGQVLGSLLPLECNKRCVDVWERDKDKYLYKGVQ
ncbi:MAG: sodium:solute symporter family protein [Burkholderiaceae bacterium]|nr:sodium:solute symporter family protein [Burkholderiaceae bacterium]